MSAALTAQQMIGTRSFESRVGSLKLESRKRARSGSLLVRWWLRKQKCRCAGTLGTQWQRISRTKGSF
jgi:hypothetical protein